MFFKKKKEAKDKSSSESSYTKRKSKKDEDSNTEEKKSGLIHYLFGKREKSDTETEEIKEDKYDDVEENDMELEEDFETEDEESAILDETPSFDPDNIQESPHIIKFDHEDMRTLLNLKTGERKSSKSPTGKWVSNPESTMKVVSTTGSPSYNKDSIELDDMTINIKKDGSIIIKPSKEHVPEMYGMSDSGFPQKRRSL